MPASPDATFIAKILSVETLAALVSTVLLIGLSYGALSADVAANAKNDAEIIKRQTEFKNSIKEISKNQQEMAITQAVLQVEVSNIHDKVESNQDDLKDIKNILGKLLQAQDHH